jgi:hypothetical protein
VNSAQHCGLFTLRSVSRVSTTPVVPHSGIAPRYDCEGTLVLLQRYLLGGPEVVEAECRVDQQRAALLLHVDRFLQRWLHTLCRRVVGCMLHVACCPLQLANTCCTLVDAHIPAALNGGTGLVASKIESAESQNRPQARAALPTVRAVTRLPRAECDGIATGRTEPRDRNKQTNDRQTVDSGY